MPVQQQRKITEGNKTKQTPSSGGSKGEEILSDDEGSIGREDGPCGINSRSRTLSRLGGDDASEEMRREPLVLQVAVHVRRGDVGPTHHRFLPVEDWVEGLTSLTGAITQEIWKARRGSGGLDGSERGAGRMEGTGNRAATENTARSLRPLSNVTCVHIIVSARIILSVSFHLVPFLTFSPHHRSRLSYPLPPPRLDGTHR